MDELNGQLDTRLRRGGCFVGSFDACNKVFDSNNVMGNKESA